MPTSHNSSVSILGLGAMGARMAARLLAAGHPVTVWNRTPEAAGPLRDQGAAVAPTPREAAAAGDIVVSIVRDDEASRAVWSGPDGALAGLPPGTVAVESSTLTPERIREWAEQVASAGAVPLDAPVVGSRPQAEAGALAYLVGGDGEALERARPVFGVLGGAVHHVGPVGQGAAMKLAVNALFALQVAACAELVHFLRRAGIEPERAVEVLGALPVTSPAAGAALGAIAARRFDPLFPVALVEKDLRYAQDAAESVGAALPLASAGADVFAQAQAAGYGDLNVTGVARLYE